ncbi:MAG: AAA family ATPase [Candidatus Aenigmatarchaeota archaeon]
MPKEVRFESPELTKYEQEIERLREAGGFLLEKKEEGKNIIHFLGLRGIGPYERDVKVSFETDIEDEKELQEILEEMEVCQTPLFRKILTFLVDSYNQERIPFLQSVPGTGKTYACLLFNKLLHGKDAPVVYIACTPRTSELELIGHWSPREGGISPQELSEELEKIKEWQEFKASFDRELEQLVKKKNVLSENEFQQELGKLIEKFMETQKNVLALIGKKTEDFVFRRGVILLGFKDPKNPEDEGRFVIIDEIDNLPENYQNILLQLSGPGGKLTTKFTSYSDSGVTEYERGEKTFFVLLANYPELTTGKRAISSPLADRVDFLAILPQESVEDEEFRIREFGFRELSRESKRETKKEEEKQKEKEKKPKEKKKRKTWEERLQESLRVFDNAEPEIKEEIRKLLSDTLALWHGEFKRRLLEYRQEGLELARGGTRIREQEKEFSQRAIIGVEDYVLSHLNERDFLNPETGRVDLAKLLTTAFEHHYLYFLASENLRISFLNEVVLLSLYGGRKRIEKENVEWKEKEVPEEVAGESRFLYKEEGGKFRKFNPAKDNLKDALPLDKVLDILVERAFMTKEEKIRQEEQKEEEERRKLLQGLYNAQDKIEEVLRIESLPEEVKKILENKLKKIKDKISNISK